MRKLTANDLLDYEVEITEMDGNDAYGFITSAQAKDGSELTEEELDWLNDNGNVEDIIYEAGQDKMQSDGDFYYDCWKDS
jgi:hypothetical protein